MERTSVSAPISLMKEARELEINFSEVFQDALKISVGMKLETFQEQEAERLRRRLALIEAREERRRSKEGKKDAMFAMMNTGNRGSLDDRFNLAWIESRRKEFGLLREDPRELLSEFRARQRAPEVR